MDEQRRKTRKRIGLAMALVVLLLWVFWPSPAPPPPIPPTGHTPSEKAFRERISKVGVLPFEGTPVIPYQRPESELPIMYDIFEEVELTLNGKRIEPESELRFQEGERIPVTIDVKHNDKVPLGIDMSGNGIGLACRAETQEGWMIMDPQFMGDSVSSNSLNKFSHCEGVWVVPERRGTFLLGILGEAEVPHAMFTPVRLLRTYPLVIE